MSIEIKIPSVGESVSEIEIGEWLKSEGDTVEEDEVLVTLESDKAGLDLPSPAGGTLEKIVKKQGEAAEVGEVIGLIEETNGAAATSKSASGQRSRKKSEKSRGGSKKDAAGDSKDSKGSKGSKDSKDSKDESRNRSSRKRNERLRKERSGAPMDETAEDESTQDARDAEDAGDEWGSGSSESRRVSPVAQRLLEEYGLSAEDIRLESDGDRIGKSDVLREIERRSSRAKESGESGDGADSRGGQREEETVRMSPIRRRIASRLVEAQSEAALLTTVNDVDMTAINELRKRHGETFQDRHEIKLGLMSFFVKAAVDALGRTPALNAEVRGDDIVYKKYFDIGIAVGGGKGLVVPVLRNAERMGFAEIEATIADFARRASDGTLELEELRGGTFTISNGGVYGSLLSTPIVNPPQSAILGLHRIEERAVVRDGEIVARPMMYMALTYDHRLVDGREAVTFLRRIKETIEDPSRLIFDV